MSKTWWSWRGYGAFMLALVPVLFVGAKLITLVHELAHFLGAAVFGAPPQKLIVSILGGGAAQSDWDTVAGGGSVLGHSVCTAAGIVVTAAAGIVVLLLAGRARRPLASLFLSLCGSLAVLDSLSYAALGLEHGFGDPESLLQLLGAGARPPRCYDRGLALPFLLIAPLVSYLALRPYARVQQRYFPAPRLWQRMLVGALTLGALALPVAVVAAGALAKNDEAGARRCYVAPVTLRLMEQYRDDDPGLSTRQVIDKVLAYRRAHPFQPPPRPLSHVLTFPLLLLACGFGGVLALWRAREQDAAAAIGGRELLLMWGLLVVSIGLLVLTGQPLFYSPMST